MRTETKDGGPAFPTGEAFDPQSSNQIMQYKVQGMTLRDYFAAAAIPALIGHAELMSWATKETADGAEWRATVAGWAFKWADAMLAARTTDGETTDA